MACFRRGSDAATSNAFSRILTSKLTASPMTAIDGSNGFAKSIVKHGMYE